MKVREHRILEGNFPFAGSTNLRVRGKTIKSHGRERFLVLEIRSCSATFPFRTLRIRRDNPVPTITKPEEDINVFVPAPTPTGEGVEDLPIESEIDSEGGTRPRELRLAYSRFEDAKNVEVIDEKVETERRKPERVISPLPVGQVVGWTTSFGTQSGSGHVRTTLNTTIVERERADIDLRIFIEAIGILARDGEFSVHRRAAVPGLTEYLPIVPKSKDKPDKPDKWGYLNSRRKIPRKVVVADIGDGDRLFTLVEFEKRPGENHRLGIIEAYRNTFVRNDELRRILFGLSRKYGVWDNLRISFVDLRISAMNHSIGSGELLAEAIKSRLCE